jgi:magnesium-transporting ATPase (P-type)
MDSTLSSTIHELPVNDVYAALVTSPDGLAVDETTLRLQRYGRNAIRDVQGKPIYIKLIANFTHLMAWLLWAGGVIAFIAQMPQLGVAIWAVNLINGVFSFWQEYKAEKATEALRRLLPHYVRVLRAGQEQRILAEELVPGDVMLLSEGDRISADARLVAEAELRVDQSTLSGESHPVRKTSDAVINHGLARAEISNLVFAGSNVVSGGGKAVVFATGMESEFGKIARLTQSVGDDLSPLQKEMMYATKIVTLIAVAAGVVFFILGVMFGVLNWLEGFIFAMGMIVAFVPEGMLPTVTLALAMGTQRMANRHALIKRLSAVETLGCTSVICTDKTGTLTQNEMTVTDLWSLDRRYCLSGVGYAPNGQILYHERPLTVGEDGNLLQLLTAACLCNNARLLAPDSQANHTLSGQWTILGDPTEAALLVAAGKADFDVKASAEALPRWREFPFESRRKRMSTVHRLGNEPDDDYIFFVKGAPKEMLALCTRVWVDGAEQAMTAAMRIQIAEANDAYARNALRVLAIANRRLANQPGLALQTPEEIEQDLTFLGLAAMMDPPRATVSAAVETCHKAGIRIVMITGDYGLTAESIARRIRIIRGDQPRIVTGVELEAMSDAQLSQALAGEVIFARVAPEHKLRVVTALQAMGYVVAVTGDGVNDAPALKKADIGVAMGVAGSDVAKEAADMVLTDDNFASIVSAVEEGRAVYANIKKFITYIFTSNTPEAVPFILFVLSSARIPLALNVMHILSIDLGTDIMPALALGAEPPEPGVMQQPPRNLGEHVITRRLLWRAYPLLGSVQSLAAMAAFYFQYWSNGYWGQWLDLPSAGWLYQSATAMALAAVVATQIGNLFAQRSERISVFRLNWLENRLIWLGIASELIVVVLLVYAPPLQWLFGTAAFAPVNWLFLLAWVPALLIVDELRKYWLRRQSVSP